jgi:hypothetical protein
MRSLQQSMLLLLCLLLYALQLVKSFQPVSYTNPASSPHSAQVAAHSSTRLYSSREDELRDKIAKLRKAQGQGKSYEAVMGYVQSKFSHYCMYSKHPLLLVHDSTDLPVCKLFSELSQSYPHILVQNSL